MKFRYYMGIAVTWLLVYGCSADYMSFEGSNRIQFETKTDEIYTFTYFPQTKQIDTFSVKIVTLGEITDYPRTIKFEQVTKEWKYIYDEEEPQKIVDSTFAEMDYPAIAGVHFEPLGENNELTLPAHQNSFDLRVIVKRSDTDLQKNARKLYLRLIPSADFGTGESLKLVKHIIISDKLERPTRWKDNSYYYKLYLGNWSERKHRFMIDVTGQKWDNNFLLYIVNNYDTWSLRDYYLTKIKSALAAYNADPKNNPPMKDENGHEVVFP